MRRCLRFVLLAAIAVAPSQAAPNAHLARTVHGSILLSNSIAIYRRDPSGALTKLTTATGADFDLYPAWSRSGTRIAFERGRPPDASCSLMVMNSDGSGLHRVGQVKTDCSGASWGPNDEQLVFGSGPPVVALRIVNVDGTGLHTLLRRRARYGNPQETGTDPAWSPDGRTIVLSWSLGPVAGLDAVRPSGTHLRALVRPRIHRGGVYGQPSWSRDGKRLAFVYYDSLARTRTITVSTSTGLRRHALTGLLDHPTPPGRLGRPQLVDGRLPACLLRRVRSDERLRVDDPEPRRKAAAARARSLAAAQLGPGRAIRQWGGSALRCSPPYRSPLSSVAARHTMRAL